MVVSSQIANMAAYMYATAISNADGLATAEMYCC
jgi:hypothetical protein